MFDVASLTKIGKALGWFLTIGKTETKEMRDAILDLLRHSSQSIRTLVELQATLNGPAKEMFTEKAFIDIWIHCKYALTGNDAPELARTHCTDIMRDLRRINFIAAKTLRTELGSWSDVDSWFADLRSADADFLESFATCLRTIDVALDEIQSEFKASRPDGAWTKFVALRKAIDNDVQNLNDTVGQMRRADDHIRAVLT